MSLGFTRMHSETILPITVNSIISIVTRLAAIGFVPPVTPLLYEMAALPVQTPRPSLKAVMNNLLRYKFIEGVRGLRFILKLTLLDCNENIHYL